MKYSYQKDFPLFAAQKNLTYLDSAATSLKPKVVIDAISDYYSNYSANVSRGLYPISVKATEEYEKTRGKVAYLIHAKSSEEIIFTSGTTESINLVAYAWGRLHIDEDDEIVTTVLEHHSNFLPWKELAQENGAVLKVISLTEDKELDIFRHKKQIPEINSGQALKQVQDDINLKNIITSKTKLVAVSHVSNVLGTINPIKKIVSAVKKINPNCLVLVDGAQAVPHMSVDVQDLGCDFYAFSGHKMLGPTGIGVLWMKKELADKIPPFKFGGGMIESVTLEKSTYAPSPQKFEGGTPHIAGVIGLGVAVDYMQKVGLDTIRNHEIELTTYAIEQLERFGSVQLYGPKNVRHRGGVLSFNLYDEQKKLIHPHDVADLLGQENICVRAGHHCAMPLHHYLEIPASVRASFYIYNTKEDVDQLIIGLEKVRKIFS